MFYSLMFDHIRVSRSSSRSSPSPIAISHAARIIRTRHRRSRSHPPKSHTTALGCAPSTRIPHVSHPAIPRHTPGGNEEGVMILRQTNQAPGNAPFLGILNSHPFPAHHESDAMPGFFVIMPANVVLPLHATPPILQAGNGSNRYNSSPTPSFYMPSSGG